MANQAPRPQTTSALCTSKTAKRRLRDQRARRTAAAWEDDVDKTLSGRSVWKWDCWVFKIGRLLDRKSSITALNLSKTHSKWWGASRPTILNGFWTGLAPFRPHKSTISGPETGRF